MTNLAQVRLITEGYVGAPGYNVLNFSMGTVVINDWNQSLVDQLYDEAALLIADMHPTLRSGITISVDPDVRIFDAGSGETVDVIPTTSDLAMRQGTGGTSQVPRSTCMYIRFSGDKFLHGRRISGGMYVGPLAGAVLDTSGNIEAGYVINTPDWFTGITSGIGPRLAVWHRPSVKGASDGEYADVIRTTVRPRPSNLRSRAI